MKLIDMAVKTASTQTKPAYAGFDKVRRRLG